MSIHGKYCSLVLQAGVTYAPEIHRTSMYTEYTRTYYKRYVIAYEVQDTYGFRKLQDTRRYMEAVVLACRTYACPAIEVVFMVCLTNPNTHPSADYNKYVYCCILF